MDDCENKLLVWKDNVMASVDLPEPKRESTDKVDFFIVVEVTKEDTYKVEGKEYSYDELLELVELKIEESGLSNRKIKIAGDRMAHYQAIFNLLSLIQKKGLNPILAYDS